MIFLLEVHLVEARFLFSIISIFVTITVTVYPSCAVSFCF